MTSSSGLGGRFGVPLRDTSSGVIWRGLAPGLGGSRLRRLAAGGGRVGRGERGAFRGDPLGGDTGGMATLHHVLVVEDDTDIANLVRIHLERAGYQVSRAADGKAAIKRFDEGAYDLVILDL